MGKTRKISLHPKKIDNVKNVPPLPHRSRKKTKIFNIDPIDKQSRFSTSSRREDSESVTYSSIRPVVWSWWPFKVYFFRKSNAFLKTDDLAWLVCLLACLGQAAVSRHASRQTSRQADKPSQAKSCLVLKKALDFQKNKL